AVFTALGLPVRLVFEIDQIVRVVVAAQDHVAALPAVPAVGAAEGLKFLTPEAGASATSVAGPGFDDAFVDKHGRDRAESPRLAKGRIYLRRRQADVRNK